MSKGIQYNKRSWNIKRWSKGAVHRQFYTDLADKHFIIIEKAGKKKNKQKQKTPALARATILDTIKIKKNPPPLTSTSNMKLVKTKILHFQTLILLFYIDLANTNKLPYIVPTKEKVSVQKKKQWTDP